MTNVNLHDSFDLKKRWCCAENYCIICFVRFSLYVNYMFGIMNEEGTKQVSKASGMSSSVPIIKLLKTTILKIVYGPKWPFTGCRTLTTKR